MTSIRGRRRAPLSMLALGAVIAVAAGLGQGWGAVIAVAVVTMAGAVFYYGTGLRRYGARGEHADDPGPGDDTDDRAPAPVSTW
ncbi:MAG: hypothetical protein ACRDOU_05225 [Streptosporangiaceae bacterium]